MNAKEYYEKYGLMFTPIVFEFHLYEPDVKDLERIDEEVRVIEIRQKVEFGFERNGKDKVNIEFGIGKIEVDREIFMEAYARFIGGKNG